MIKAAIFDMDGLLVNSEPFWQQAQLDIFQSLGVRISLEDTLRTTGIRIDQIVEDYFYQQPWQTLSCEAVTERIVRRVEELIQIHQPIMPGVHEILTLCRDLNLRIGLASSSPMRLIKSTLKALDLTDIFDVVVSAETLPYGKPHPEVYLNAAAKLNVLPSECVAFEDSFNGLLAAKSALMRTCVIPEASSFDEPKWIIADCCRISLCELSKAEIIGA